MMQCWKCYDTLDDMPPKLPFRAVCDHCHSWQHVCKNCKYHKQGLPNDCFIPDTLSIADKEKCNFCEEFVIKEAGEQENGPSIEDISKRLFQDDGGSPQTQKEENAFDALFDD